MAFCESKRAQATEYDTAVAHAFNLCGNGKPCFFCGGVLRDVIEDHTMYWMGRSGETIYLHPQCAIDFATHLIKDGMIGVDPGTIVTTPEWMVKQHQDKLKEYRAQAKRIMQKTQNDAGAAQ
jgi:hypothetical protein